MAAISITASQVLKGTAEAAQFDQGIAAAAITAGQPVYRHTDGTIKLAITTTAATAAAVGIALHAAAVGHPIQFQTADLMTLGAAAAMTIGETYAVDSVAGNIVPLADVGAAEFVTILGIAITAATLKVRIFASGVAHG